MENHKSFGEFGTFTYFLFGLMFGFMSIFVFMLTSSFIENFRNLTTKNLMDFLILIGYSIYGVYFVVRMESKKRMWFLSGFIIPVILMLLIQFFY